LFGYGENQPLTLENTGELFGITRERVRQIKEIAFEKLREEPALSELMEDHLRSVESQ